MKSNTTQLPPSIEQAFQAMTEEQRRMSFSMNTKNVLTQSSIKQDYLCALCHAILVDPMKCKECKNRFHKSCLNKFCRETGQCPMMCKNPKFISIKKEVEKQLNELKFQCSNYHFGCDKVLSYQEAQFHEQDCKYSVVKCPAFKQCKTKTIRKELPMHEAICPNVLVPCIYCMKSVQRIDLINHEKEYCAGSHVCHMCNLVVSKEEIKANSHNCFQTLALYLQRMIGEKDQVIKLMREEISRKNMTIRQLIDRQITLEQKLGNIEGILLMDDTNMFSNTHENSSTTSNKSPGAADDEDQHFSNGKDSQLNDDIVEEKKEEESSEQIEKALQQVPEQYKEHFKEAFNLIEEARQLKEQRDWESVTKTANTELKIRIHNEKVCVKSTAQIPSDPQTIKNIIIDMKQRQNYDDTFDKGHKIIDLPLGVYVTYQQYKKILLTAKRDLISLCKIHYISKREIVITACSIQLESHPEEKVARAESPISAWFIKQVGDNLCKVTFVAEIDYKCSIYISKQVVPKIGHQTFPLRNYVIQQNKKDKK